MTPSTKPLDEMTIEELAIEFVTIRDNRQTLDRSARYVALSEEAHRRCEATAWFDHCKAARDTLKMVGIL